MSVLLLMENRGPTEYFFCVRKSCQIESIRVCPTQTGRGDSSLLHYVKRVSLAWIVVRAIKFLRSTLLKIQYGSRAS